MFPFALDSTVVTDPRNQTQERGNVTDEGSHSPFNLVITSLTSPFTLKHFTKKSMKDGGGKREGRGEEGENE